MKTAPLCKEDFDNAYALLGGVEALRFMADDISDLSADDPITQVRRDSLVFVLRAVAETADKVAMAVTDHTEFDHG